MVCLKCKRQFDNAVLECPDCKISLIAEKFPDSEKLYSIQDLTRVLRENNNQLKINIVTTEVGREKKWRFPKFGYGFAWAERMQGILNNTCEVDLQTVNVGNEEQWNILMLGYGFAWAAQIEGRLGDIKFTLAATKVERQKQWNILGFGYGFAWVSEMAGKIGDKITVNLVTTEIAREKEFAFPGFGFGFAWAKKAVLYLKLD